MAKEKEYEIVMYKLLAMVLIGVFLSLTVGFIMGNELGKARAFDSANIDKPDYCWAEKQGDKLVVNCNEVNISISTMCETLSEEVQDNFKLVVIG